MPCPEGTLASRRLLYHQVLYMLINGQASVMTTRRLILLWFVLAALFDAIGFYLGGLLTDTEMYGLAFWRDSHRVFGVVEALIVYGGIGFTAATCIVIGLRLVSRVSCGALKRSSAVLAALITSLVSAVIPLIVLFCVCSSDLRGEGAMVLVFQAMWTLGVGVFTFVIFSIITLCIRHR